ncbi:MAG: tRNA (adenosine(37)-N6)-threonylcarbamoyltransferase complex transferase subunit TsaD [Candidatus Pacebacteria bacterium]|nr:tRNA (adenosine(37)-N6)-threonylcarbamoyltransferase complex transferase subunit TsaD [Candidatus Paceibacterota bacterium]
MKILAIETSCDETAVSVLEATGTFPDVRFTVHGNALYSQAKLHAAFGGVYPTLAKREHVANLTPLLVAALREAKMYDRVESAATAEQITFCNTLFSHEPRLCESVLRDIPTLRTPDIDAIAVTQGPGLEPALWVGINFARALAYFWNLPIIPVNHLEGHLVASAVQVSDTPRDYVLEDIPFPVLGLLISGGHTEFVYARAWGSYEVIGATRDDSVGEAFDKIARLLDLPYPGGPEISRYAARGRPSLLRREVLQGGIMQKPLPRPMATSDDLDFSFSGLKTAVKYALQAIPEITDVIRDRMCAEFEEAVVDVFSTKTKRALAHYATNTFVLGGGVSANTYIRARLADLIASNGNGVAMRVPAQGLSTDNAIMIGMAAYLDHLRNTPTAQATDALQANGNLSL